jgi:hypothetical protein
LEKCTLPAVIAFLFFPSVVFWTSGMIKESIAIGGLFYLAAIFLKIWFNKKIRLPEFLLAAIMLWICWNLKYYFMAIFLPVVLSTLLFKFIFQKRRIRRAVFEIVAWVAMFILPLFLISFLHPNFYPERFLEVIVSNNSAYNQLSEPGDVIVFTDLQGEVGSIIRNAPWALFSGLFRPFFWEATTILQFFSGIENSLLLLFTAIALFQIKTNKTSPHRILVLSVIVYVALLCIFVTLSAPNFGTLSRYRGAYLSFFVFLLLCCQPVVIYLQRSLHGLLVNKSESTFAD